jgi:trehalose-6-phosphate synthase
VAVTVEREVLVVRTVNYIIHLNELEAKNLSAALHNHVPRTNQYQWAEDFRKKLNDAMREESQ